MTETPDDSLPICIDLTAFGKLMETRDDKIASLLRRTKLTQACHADIKGAHSSLIAFNHWMHSDVSAFTNEHSLTIQSALLTKAIVLYARATHGSADKGGRGSVQIKNRLPDDLKVEHDLIIDLRNRAIVHSHLGKEIGERVWEEQQLLLVQIGEGYKPMYTTRTTQIDYKAIVSLYKLLNFALDFYHQRFVEQSNQIVTRMHEAGFTEAELLEHAIDPTPYFSDAATFKGALANMPRL